ncbi:hypothetical protein [Rhizobium sp. BK176]|uniref:hypothetical protein n=1 Tax=Rhizobium sp. BK176 TaxID=2587071 RepID=UPI002169DE61|nr:hypothetical protein [Rhizobium sp. BK176]MCS4089708.1 hypothetical protein [Rhizobium sp. BK176]
MSLKSIVLASALAVIGATSAMAIDDFQIPQAITIPAYAFADKVDIIGLKPGMKADEALRILKERKPEIYIDNSQFGNRVVRSVEFPSRYSSWERENEEINVLMVSPSSGNEVFSVSRSLEFWRDEKRPDYETTVKALTDKYGKPSAEEVIPPTPGDINHRGRSTTLMWYFGGEGKCDLKKFDGMMSNLSDLCTKVTHQTGPSVTNVMYSPAKLESYQKTATAGSDVILVAKVYNHDDDNRVFGMSVSFVDLKRRALTAEEDLKLVKAEQAKFDSVKNPAPEL